MRVLLVGPYPIDPARVGGGVEASFVNLVAGLAECLDVQPEVVSFVSGMPDAEHRTVAGVPVDYLPASKRHTFLTRHAHERRVLQELVRVREPDIVHAQDTLGSGYVCLRAVRNTPVVVSVHGIVREELEYVPRGSERLRLRLFGLRVERYCIRHARFVVAPTRYAEQYFGREINGRIWEVGNAISERYFSIDPEPTPGRILYAGALIQRKRLLDLVEALPTVLAVVPHARLRVAGSLADPTYAGRVESRVRDLGLEASVDLLGSLGLEELLDEYRQASMLVLPSGQETSPMVVGEAMAAALPVVATRIGGVSYLVDEGVTGYLVDRGDVPHLAARIVAILSDPGVRARFGAAGRAKADQDFRTQAVAARARAVYEEVLRVAST